MRPTRAAPRLFRKSHKQNDHVSSAPWWYIELKSGTSPSIIQQRLCEQGATAIEWLSDRILRCQSTSQPILPPCVSYTVFAAPDSPSSADSTPSYQAGQIVRILSGPATGWVGRVTAVIGKRVKVEILVWGKGMTVEVDSDHLTTSSSFPWE